MNTDDQNEQIQTTEVIAKMAVEEEGTFAVANMGERAKADCHLRHRSKMDTAT